MTTTKANLLNSLTLIAIPLWAFFTFEPTLEKPDNYTALIPIIFGLILLACNKGVKNENKTIAHIAVLITLIALVAIYIKPFLSAIEEARYDGVIRCSIMMLTGILAMITFVRSFIANRRSRQ